MANNFTFKVKVILGLESTCPDGSVVKIGLNDPMTNRVQVWKYFQGLTIKTNNFAFEFKVILDIESTCTDGLGAKTGLNGPKKSEKVCRV